MSCEASVGSVARDSFIVRITIPRSSSVRSICYNAHKVPALPPVSNVIRLTLTHSDAADVDVQTHLFWQYTGTAPTNAQLNTMAAALASPWAGAMGSYCFTDVQLTRVDIVDLSSSTAAVGTALVSETGTRSGHTNAGAVAVLINYGIARRYRGGKPRSYLPYLVAEDLTTPQEWNATTLTALVGAWEVFLAAVESSVWSGGTIAAQVNVSYYSGFQSVQNPITKRWRNISTPRTAPIIDSIAAIKGNPKPGSQRRRNLH